jgi:hypothetical protein
VPHIASIPTVSFNLLYVLVIVRLARRELFGSPWLAPAGRIDRAADFCNIWLAEERKPMDDPNSTTVPLEADEDMLTYTVSDEVIEAAAGIESGAASILPPQSEPCLLRCRV